MSYSSEVLADSPSGYYPLTTNATDSSGNGRNGTTTGSLSFAGAGPSGIGGNSASGWSSSNYITLPGAAYAAGALTFEAWVKTSSAAWSFFFAVNSNQGLFGVDGGTGKLTYVASAGVNDDASVGVSDGAWHHAVATRDGSSNLLLYVDKVQVGSYSSVGAPTATTIRIGTDASSANAWTGSIAHVAVYPTALSSARVAAHFNAAFPDATVAPPAATATATAVVPVVSSSSSVLPPAATASAAAVVPTITTGTNATVAAPAATATATAHAPVITQIIPAATDVSNFLNGRNRRARASVTVTSPVGAAPSRAAVRYDKAVPYPPPTLVDGRPT